MDEVVSVNSPGADTFGPLSGRAGTQPQRYEATDYCSASLTRLKQVAKALGVNIAGEMTYSR